MSMDLDLDQMRSVVVLAEQLHFGRAASALYISQPALTKQIHKIEQTLGGPLFSRKPRQLTLTRAGAVLVERARSVLRDAQLAIDVSRSAVRGEAGLLRIGFGLASLATGLPDLVQRFRRRFPGVQISLREMSTPPQIEALKSRALDVGFVRLPVQSGEISSSTLFADHLVLAVGPQEGKEESNRGLKSFAERPFILVSRSASASLHDHIVRTCHAAGFLPRVVQEVGELFTVLNFVRAGAGIALVPNSCKVMNVPRVRFVETRVPGAAWNIGVAFHHSCADDPTIHNFVSLVHQQFHSHLAR
jgi:DNA-binding transcriptional LysR family regulator